jgi:hypothetical protein
MFSKSLIAIGLAVIMASSAAQAGGFVVCGPGLGCVGMPYLRPPIVPIQRPIIIPAPAARVPCRLWRGEPVPFGCAAPRDVGPPSAPPPQYAQQPTRRSRPNVEVPPPDDSKAEIEGDIMQFCDAHPDERFCGKLGAYLRQHPDARPRQ